MTVSHSQELDEKLNNFKEQINISKKQTLQ